MAKVRVACIDAGFTNLGWAVAELKRGTQERVLAFGVEKTKKHQSGSKLVTIDNVHRIRCLARVLEEVQDAYEPKAWFMELPNSGGKSSAAIKGMAFALAMLATWAEVRKIPCEMMIPTQTKKACIGKSGASKAEVEEFIRDTYKDPKGENWFHANEHVFDALSALYAGRTSQIYRLLAAKVG